MPLCLVPKPVAHRLDGPLLLQRRPDVAHGGADLELGEPLVLVCVVLSDALLVLEKLSRHPEQAHLPGQYSIHEWQTGSEQVSSHKIYHGTPP